MLNTNQRQKVINDNQRNFRVFNSKVGCYIVNHLIDRVYSDTDKIQRMLLKDHNIRLTKPGIISAMRGLRSMGAVERLPDIEPFLKHGFAAFGLTDKFKKDFTSFINKLASDDN